MIWYGGFLRFGIRNGGWDDADMDMDSDLKTDMVLGSIDEYVGFVSENFWQGQTKQNARFRRKMRSNR